MPSEIPRIAALHRIGVGRRPTSDRSPPRHLPIWQYQRDLGSRFSINAEGGQIYSRNFAHRLSKMMPAMVLRIPKAVQVALRKTVIGGDNQTSERAVAAGRMNWICMCLHVGGSACPILVTCRKSNAATIPRTFASLQRPAIRSRGREIPRTIACSEAIRRRVQRPRFRPNRGRTDCTLAASDAMTRMRSDARGGRSSAVDELGFLWAVNPKNGPDEGD